MAPMGRPLLERAMADMCPNFVLSSGQTEMYPATTMSQPDRAVERFGNYWGESLIVNETAIMDDDGNLLPRGQVGELVHRGPNVMMGYYKDPKATEEARKFGWHHTGDLALIDENGEVLFLDRKKDMIKSGGENVASVKIEETLLAHPAVQNAAVVGLPHPQWGEAVSAFVKLKPGAQADEAGIAEHCRKHLGGFQVPKLVRILDEMPMTATGKLRKVELRQAFSRTFYRKEERIMAILESTIAPGSAPLQGQSRRHAGADRAHARAGRAHARGVGRRQGPLPQARAVAAARARGAGARSRHAFIELSTLAGYMFDVPDADKSVPGGGLIAGIGFVSGIRCMVSANDSGIDAGALQPYGLDKTLRVQELALENKLPYVQLVESAGANLLRYRVEDFVRGGNIFRNLARLSAAGLPVVTVTHGSSTAGGAYQTGLSDYIVMVRGRTRAFLAGPPLLKAATGEIATEEELGGAEMHTSISGLGDYLAEDDRDALRIARDIMANLEWDRPKPAEASFKPPRYDAEELLGIMPMDHKRPVDMRAGDRALH